MTSLFRRIRDWLKPPPQTGLPLSLTQGDFNALRRLRGMEEYDVFLKVLDDRLKFIGDSLLASTDAYTDGLLKGQALGLKRAGTLVDEILLTQEHKVESERRQNDARDARAESSRKLGLYGTPAWKAGFAAGRGRSASSGKP